MKISNGARVNGGREPLEKPIYDRLNSKYAAHGAPFRPCNGQPKNQRSSIEWPPRQALDPNAFAKYLSSGRSRSNTQTKARERQRERQRERESRETVINRERERESVTCTVASQFRRGFNDAERLLLPSSTTSLD